MTWKHGDTTFIGRSDLTGDVKIITDRFDEVTVPFGDLINFVVQLQSEADREADAAHAGLRDALNGYFDREDARVKDE